MGVYKVSRINFIEPEQSKWASPILILRKNEKAFWFCVYYHHLSAVTLKQAYLIPWMEEDIDRLGQAFKFSTVEVDWGYWQF